MVRTVLIIIYVVSLSCKVPDFLSVTSLILCYLIKLGTIKDNRTARVASEILFPPIANL